MPAQREAGACPSERCFGSALIKWQPALAACARDVKVGIIDTGFDKGHPALSGVRHEHKAFVPDGSVSATISPDHKVDKATVVSDEETSAIVDAVEAYNAMPDPAWLNQSLRGQTLIERLNRAMNWVLTVRRDPDTQLIKRAHTTDWGDVKWEPNSNPSPLRKAMRR